MMPPLSSVPDLSRAQHPIGVVIPTWNRADALLRCIQHLERQTMRDFEVVIVDDGSTDSTPALLERIRKQTSLDLRCLRQPNSGAARARNRGIAHLRAPVCLMLGDDIFASPDLLSTHLALHTAHPELCVAGLGLTRWSATGQRITKLMLWLDASGVQFAYEPLLAGTRPDWRHFYTSNLSLKTEVLRAHPFDESFCRYGMEDMELGFRLQNSCGLEIEFLPQAIAYHLHPTNLRKSCSRMVGVGAASRKLHGVWPQTASAPRKSTFGRVLRAFVAKTPWLVPWLLPPAEILTRFWCPNPLMRYLLAASYERGYRQSPDSAAPAATANRAGSPLPER